MPRLCLPAEVERRTGLSPDTLRDWRRRGLLTSGQQQENGRWAYAVGDVAQLAIVNFLVKWRIVSDLTDAFQIAGFAVPHVFALVTEDSELAARVSAAPYLVAFTVREGARLQIEAVSNISSVCRLLVPGFIVVDTRRVALVLSEPLDGLFDEAGRGKD